jgi:shikimate kinase
VHEKTLCVYLKASVETLIEHLSGQTSGRPLLKAGASGDNGKENDDANDALRKRIMDLMSKRAATYERTAHIIIETDGKSIDEVAQEIVKRLQKNS